MPSFRTIFLVAATAFAALTSAAPLNIPNNHGLGDFVSDVIDLDVAGSYDFIDIKRSIDYAHYDHEGPSVVSVDDSGPPRAGLVNFETREGERSLWDTIVLASARISVIHEQMKKVTSQDKVDDDAVRQPGRPMEEILSLNGQVMTKVQLADLLVALANLVCGLLYIAATVSAKVTVDVIVSVGVVFAEIFCASFTVVDGLFVIVRPGLDTAIKIPVNLKLDALVSAYNGVY
ncbi:hypothetical protein H0H81_010654 [Sphagnurus paluster]|uniref:Uncharacterized protein n=1 Tax=Sphagnurus paluster TaxID=117069 RepID=A0A9P7FQU9_9AGAR|nr:hypothetical protein H0H81_010654 [Sphagnurus paluster]